MQNKSAVLAALTNALIIGFSFLFVKMALTFTNPVDTLAHRFTASFVAATIPVLCGWVRLSIKPKDILPLVPLALFYPASFFAFQVFGLVYTSSSEAGIITATSPIFTMVLAMYFLKETSTWMQKICTLLSVVGVVYIFAMKGVQFHAGNSTGTILILLSALSLAAYSVLARKMTRSFHCIDVTYMMAAIGFVFFNALSLIRHGADGTLNQYFAPLSHPLFIVAVVYLGVLSSLVTSFLTNFALTKMEASKLSVFNNVGTLVTIVTGVLVLQEQLSYYHLIGAVLIIVGVIGTNFLGSGRTKPRPVSKSQVS